MFSETIEPYISDESAPHFKMMEKDLLGYRSVRDGNRIIAMTGDGNLQKPDHEDYFVVGGNSEY
jgi:hypothetical protein